MIIHCARRKTLPLTLIALFGLPAYAGQGCIQGGPGIPSPIGCIREEFLDKIASFRNDDEAAKKAITLFVASGACTLFNPSETVFVQDHRFFAQRAQVRRQGELARYWMPTQWVNDQACSAPPSAPTATNSSASVAAAVSLKSLPSQQSKPRVETRMGAPAPTSMCEYKPVMTDEDIAACR